MFFPALSPLPFSLGSLSGSVRVIGTGHQRGDLLSDYYVAARFASVPPALRSVVRNAVDAVAGVGLDPVHIPIC
jgi:hypothetical protein